jgi:tRNA threonylcarbamoyladenosine biosynthesis protein TsaB
VIVLALDTSTNACSVALLDGDRVLASGAEPMVRGHQERLAGMVEATMGQAGMGFERLQRVASTVGPGSFTGLRVGMAFAKSIALALDIPAVGVGTLEAIAATAADQQAGGSEPALADALVAACIDARRDQLYLQAFRSGLPAFNAQAVTRQDAIALLRRHGGGRPVHLAGSGAYLVAEALPGAVVSPLESPDPVVVARLAATREPGASMQPMYLRAPDAKLPV